MKFPNAKKKKNEGESWIQIRIISWFEKMFQSKLLPFVRFVRNEKHGIFPLKFLDTFYQPCLSPHLVKFQVENTDYVETYLTSVSGLSFPPELKNL